MNIDTNNLIPWVDSVNEKPILRITHSDDLVIIQLATQEELKLFEQWMNEGGS